MCDDTRKLDEQLIRIVKSRPALYDLRIPAKQRSRIIKDSLWEEVSSNLKGQLKPDAAEARWKYLRENYIKSRRKENMRDEIAVRNGLKEHKRRGKYSFRYYEIMEFLNDALDYQKAVTRSNVDKSKKLTEIKLEKNFRNNKPKPLIVPQTETCEEKEEVETNLSKDLEFEEIDNEVSVNSSNSLLQQNSITNDNQKYSFEEAFLQCLQKPIQKPCPIDGFLVRLGEGLRRLPYRERSKLELEFLTRLHEVEELLCDEN